MPVAEVRDGKPGVVVDEHFFPSMRLVDDVMEELVQREGQREAYTLNLGDLNPDEPFRIETNAEGVNTPYLVFGNDDPLPLAPSGMDHLCCVLRMDKGDYNSLHTPFEERVFRPLCRLRRLVADETAMVPIGYAPSEVVSRGNLGVSLVNGAITAFTDTDHVRVPSYQVFDTIRQVVDTDNAVVRTFHTEEDNVTIDLLSPDLSMVVERIMDKELDFTDRIFGGMSFTHNDSGSGVTQLRTFLWRQWCLNGAISQHPIRMTRLSVQHGVDEAVEKYLAALGGSTKQFWDEVPSHYFNHVRLMAGTPYLNDADEVDSGLALAELRDIPNIPTNVRDMIENAYQADPMANTQYGVWNAITGVAHDDNVDWVTQRRLEAFAGTFIRNQIERCGTCRQKIRQRRPRRSRASMN